MLLSGPRHRRGQPHGGLQRGDMELLETIVSALADFVWNFGIPVGGGETIPLVIIALLGTGVFLTLRLGFVQVRRLGHGFGVTSGKYDGINYGMSDPKMRRNLLFENVSMGLARSTQPSPTLLCIEDLQWADPSSLALMHYIARNTR